MGDVVGAIWGEEFIAGLALGAGALALALVGGFYWRRRRRRPGPVGGVLLALATMLALPVGTTVPTALWWGVGLLVLGGLLGAVVSPRGWLSPVFTTPGAWVVSTQVVLPEVEWVRWFVFAAIVLSAPLIARFETHATTGSWTPAMFTLFSVGIVVSVPDTEEALVLMGASLPIALLSAPGSPAVFGRAGTHAALGMALWIIVQGGVGRTAVIIGATACLGLLLTDPLARLLAAGHGSLLDRLPSGWGGLVVVSLLQLMLVIAVARTAGLVARVALAGVLGATFLVSVTVGLLLGRPRTAHDH